LWGPLVPSRYPGCRLQCSVDTVRNTWQVSGTASGTSIICMQCVVCIMLCSVCCVLGGVCQVLPTTHVLYNTECCSVQLQLLHCYFTFCFNLCTSPPTQHSVNVQCPCYVTVIVLKWLDTLTAQAPLGEASLSMVYGVEESTTSVSLCLLLSSRCYHGGNRVTVG